MQTNDAMQPLIEIIERGLFYIVVFIFLFSGQIFHTQKTERKHATFMRSLYTKRNTSRRFILYKFCIYLSTYFNRTCIVHTQNIYKAVS